MPTIPVKYYHYDQSWPAAPTPTVGGMREALKIHRRRKPRLPLPRDVLELFREYLLLKVKKQNA